MMGRIWSDLLGITFVLANVLFGEGSPDGDVDDEGDDAGDGVGSFSSTKSNSVKPDDGSVWLMGTGSSSGSKVP